MASELFETYKDLQAYVGWGEADAARIKRVAHIVEQRMDVLIDDMPIARRIVDAHGGHIGIGDQPSFGAEFVITLPRIIA
jgi:hypothetical protein